jgi:DNA replication protein DnaC
MSEETQIELQSIMSKLDAMIANAPEDAEAPIPCAELPIVAIPERERANHPMIDFPDRHSRVTTLHGEEWQAAYEKALHLCENGGIVVAHGKRGTGKTQIAYEIARKAHFQHTHFAGTVKDGFPLQGKIRPCVYIKAMDIFIDLKNGFGRPDEPSEKQVINKLVDAAFLVIDEAHVRGETKYEDDKLTHIIDKRYDAMRPTMLITNLEKHEFAAQLSPSIKNRMQEIGGGIECNWASYRKQTK